MNILEYMTQHLLFLDGGMGSLLFARGMQAGELPERWNLSHPEVITQIHKEYFDAGTHVVNANTFGANCLKFSEEELEQIVRSALENARAAAAQSASAPEKWVALDIGPTGKMLAPYGDLDFEDAVEIFAKTVRLGVKYGADLIFIETMADSYETKAALLAAKENASLPVFVSNAYGADGKLMTGANPAAMVAMLEGMGADAIGVNCSLGPKALAPVVEEYLRYASVPVLLKPNAGLPQVVDGKTFYDVSPEEFAGEVAALVDKGVSIAGGCCGTTPAYIAALTNACQGMTPKAVQPKNICCVSSYTRCVRLDEAPVIIGERINPTGRKAFAQALRQGDLDAVLREAVSQQEAGADILDVNVGLPELNEAAVLPRAVGEIQAIVDLPLQIDTSHPAALEKALRRYNGKAMINSVNGKESSMASVFPLAKKYGAVVVALTLDEQGIPQRAAERIAIARRILNRAREYGLSEKDLIFDPLTMTVSTDPGSAGETLAAVSGIRQQLGCRCVLGVSNISFGLPGRELLNSTFLTLALEHGLSAAIVNPHSAAMRGSFAAFKALRGLDTGFTGYIAHCSAQQDSPAAPVKQANETLFQAIVTGRKEQAGALAGALLASTPPIELISREILPALDHVGRAFEEKKFYLPQLLMSAEAAKAAFDRIKAHFPKGTAADKCPVVLATVQGDIHDIGKNIVRLLLENYGFPVTDLGKDVAPETVVEAVVKLHAPLAGLSALMTTTVPAMEETIRQLREKAPWCRTVVGGAVLNRQYAQSIGADRYAADAMETVRYAEEIFEEAKNGRLK